MEKSKNTFNKLYQYFSWDEYYSWLVAIAVVGYPLVGLLVTLANLDSRTFTVPFRVAVLLCSLSFLLINWGLFNKWFKENIALVLFLTLYSLRLSWDWIEEIKGSPPPLEALIFFAIVCYLPCVTLGVCSQKYQVKASAARKIALMGGLGCLLAIGMNSFGFGLERSLQQNSGRLYFEAVNPITLGHLGVSTILAIVVERRRVISWLLVLPFFACAVKCIMDSGSRGAVVSLTVCMLLMIIFSRRRILMLLLCLVVAYLFAASDSAVADRLAYNFGDISSTSRVDMLGVAIDDFLRNPVFGNSYVESETLSYPHNFFIEIAMSTGLVGILLTSMFMYKAVRTNLTLVANGNLLPPLLMVQFLAGSQFSGAIWAQGALWAFLAMVPMNVPERNMTVRAP